MIAVDTNILLYAHRSEIEHHEVALHWLRDLAEGSALWALPVFCIGEFLRVATHPRIFDPPSSLEQVFAALDALLKSPSLRVLNPGPEFPALLREAMHEGDARGNLVFDAQIAALCKERGADRLLTYDRDFSRFSGLRIISPDGKF